MRLFVGLPHLRNPTISSHENRALVGRPAPDPEHGRHPVRVAGRLVAAVMFALLACGDGPTGPSLDRSANDARVMFESRVIYVGAPRSLPINYIRAIVYNAQTGAKIKTLEEHLDPAKSSFDFQLPIPLGGGPITTKITLELANRNAQGEVVEYAGRRVDLRLEPGDFRQVDINLYPGPLDNLDATGVQIVDPVPARTEGMSYQVSAVIAGAVGGSRVAWSSLDANIATVSDTGLVAAMLPGNARIVAGVGSNADTVIFQVTQRVAAVSVSPAATELARSGDTASLVARVLDPRGAEVVGEAVTWSILNPTMATVSATGRVGALAAGQTTVTAAATSDTAVKGTASVRVLSGAPRVATLTIAPVESLLASLGATLAYTVTALDATGSVIAAPTIAWASSAPGVAGISQVGSATAASNGVTSITASSDGVAAVAQLTVLQVADPKKSTLTAAPTSIAFGGTSLVSVVLRDANGNRLAMSGGVLSLAASSGTLSAVVDSANGAYSATLFGSAAGASTISAKIGAATLDSAATVTVGAVLSVTTMAATTTLVVQASAPTFTPVSATGGVGPYTFALSGGSLPAGMSFNAATGEISGTPTTSLAATVFTVTVTDASGAVSSKTFSLAVTTSAESPIAPSAPSITGITAGDGELRVAFTAPSSNGGATITNYEYSTDDGVSWTTLNPAATTGPLVITALTNGTVYQVKLRAVNSAGSGAASPASSGTPAAGVTTPGAPAITSVTAGDGQLSVTFTAPTSNGGAAITNYEYSTDDGASWTTLNPVSTTSPLVISSLTNGTAYPVKLRAVNSAGSGLASSATSGTPLTAASAPAITGITAGDSQLSVAFTAPSSNGGAAITSYEYSTDDGATWTARNPAATASPFVVTSLTNGTVYQVKVRAISAVGSGAASAATAGTPVGPPPAPTIASITAGNTQLSVAFTAPSSNGGAAISNYEYSIDDGATWITRNPAATTSPLVIAGLTNGTTYPVRLRAVNSYGVGAASTATNGTPATTPTAPAITSITAGDSQLSVVFTAPTGNGGAVVSTYDYSVDNGANWTSRSPAGTSSPLLIGSLTNGTAYDVKLRAVNSVGAGAASSATSGTPVGPPPAPSITGIEPGSGQLTVSFNPPSSNGGATITNYEYSIDNGSTWVTRSPASTGSPIVITGLANGTTYPVKLRAVSSFGGGAASSAVGATPGAPGAPTAITVVFNQLDATSHEATLSWTAPVNTGGSAISDYVIEYKIASASTWTVFPHTASTATQAVLGNLAVSTTYNFRVATKNSVGTSPYSPILVQKTTGPSERLACSQPGNSNSSTNSASITSCGGLGVNNLILIPISIGNSSTTTPDSITAPLGFNLLGRQLNGTNQTNVYYKLATSTDIAGATYNFSWSSNVKVVVTLVAYKSNALEAPAYSSTSGTSTTATSPAFTESSSSAYTLVYIFTPGGLALSSTTPSVREWIVSSDVWKNTTAGANNAQAIAVATADVDKTATGTTTGKTARTVNMDAATNWNAAVIRIRAP